MVRYRLFYRTAAQSYVNLEYPFEVTNQGPEIFFWLWSWWWLPSWVILGGGRVDVGRHFLIQKGIVSILVPFEFPIFWLSSVLGSFCAPWHNLNSLGREFQLRNCLHQICLWACLWVIFSVANVCRRTHPNVGTVIPSLFLYGLCFGFYL